MLEEV
jgi:hypothetical protein